MEGTAYGQQPARIRGTEPGGHCCESCANSTRVRTGPERVRMMFLTVLPLWVSGILLIGLPTLIAMGGPILIRRRLSLERLSTNNEVAGFKFATIGVLYAVLLAFAVI